MVYCRRRRWIRPAFNRRLVRFYVRFLNRPPTLSTNKLQRNEKKKKKNERGISLFPFAVPSHRSGHVDHKDTRARNTAGHSTRCSQKRARAKHTFLCASFPSKG